MASPDAQTEGSFSLTPYEAWGVCKYHAFLLNSLKEVIPYLRSCPVKHV